MNDASWIGRTLAAARPQAVGALLRYFRDLDAAEEAFQEASLKALQNWTKNGPPRDPVAWLIFVGRNAGIDEVRKRARETVLPDENVLSDLGDAEPRMVERIDNADYQDDVLRLLFVCCHPELPATQQIALALRIVSGLTVPEIARAFLVSEAAMEQRITRAKRKVAAAGIGFETPSAVERVERLATVSAMIYLLFNEGYSASGGDAHIREPLCEEAIRLGYLLLRMFPGEPELMGLVALMLFQHARAPARLDENGEIVLLEDQDRSLWRSGPIEEAKVLIEKAERHQRPGSYQLQAAIAYEHAVAKNAAETDWQAIAGYYQVLESIHPNPVIRLNRAVAVEKVEGAEAALQLVETVAEPLSGYFYLHGVRGALLSKLGKERDARRAFEKAISLASTPAEAAHIRKQLDRLQLI
ncbi:MULTISPECIES: RNA polymerase sigma factor [unclassified Aminobacter]|uniref:RNA polymerase sigma factor n=1 Tax=unclassified Aminobacter TaxID=2644704 RepID=UPI0004650A05|nr:MULTISPECIES: RNA polymerase sigma factor [unclassified Aminobacter]TWH28635.1 RNA polymerase sigma-70 factor (ECF subfamily) [Aminobacter sp. J15]